MDVLLFVRTLRATMCSLMCDFTSCGRHTLLLLLIIILRQTLESDFFTLGQQGGPPVLVLFSWIGSHKHFAIPPGILRGTAISTYWVSMVIRFVAVLGQGILFLDRYLAQRIWRRVLACGCGVDAHACFWGLGFRVSVWCGRARMRLGGEFPLL